MVASTRNSKVPQGQPFTMGRTKTEHVYARISDGTSVFPHRGHWVDEWASEEESARCSVLVAEWCRRRSLQVAAAPWLQGGRCGAD